MARNHLRIMRADGTLQTTLGLDDDLDGVELARDLEAAFEMKFLNADAEACRTVGDVFDMVNARFTGFGRDDRGCASAMAFYRLRRSLYTTENVSRLTPASRLDEISALSPKHLFRTIQSKSALRLPRLNRSGLGVAGLIMMVLSIVVLLVMAAGHSRLAIFDVIPAVIGGILMRVDPRAFPKQCSTLGELAREVAALNFGKLADLGARHREKDVWNVFLKIVSKHSLLPEADINSNTLVLNSHFRAN